MVVSHARVDCNDVEWYRASKAMGARRTKRAWCMEPCLSPGYHYQANACHSHSLLESASPFAVDGACLQVFCRCGWKSGCASCLPEWLFEPQLDHPLLVAELDSFPNPLNLSTPRSSARWKWKEIFAHPVPRCRCPHSALCIIHFADACSHCPSCCNGSLLLVSGPAAHNHRPSIDNSILQECMSRESWVVLSCCCCSAPFTCTLEYALVHESSIPQDPQKQRHLSP